MRAGRFARRMFFLLPVCSCLNSAVLCSQLLYSPHSEQRFLMIIIVTIGTNAIEIKNF